MDQDQNYLDMSLDEYIAKMGKDIGFSSKRDDNRNGDKFERKSKIYHDVEDEDILLKSDSDEDKAETDSETVKGPESSAAAMDCYDQQIDLRKILNTLNNKQSRASTNKDKKENQYISSNNAPNMQPLLPVNARSRSPQNNNCFNGRYGGNQKKKRRFRNRQNFRNRNCGNYNRNGRNDVNIYGYNRDKNQFLRNNNNPFSQQHKLSNISSNGVQTESKVKDITVQIPNRCINLKPPKPIEPCFQVPKSEEKRSIPIGGMTPQAQSVLSLETSHKPVTDTNDGSLKSLLGFQGNVSEEMIPLFAARLLEFVQNGVPANMHKPVYDMKLQKEIHEIQNKPMLYKCNGGEVISSDGAGVNCKINPSTSGISLNCRFA